MDRIQKRFNELSEMADEIAKSKGHKIVHMESSLQVLGEPTKTYPEEVDEIHIKLMAQWRTSVLSLLSRVFGRDSPTYNEFQNAMSLTQFGLHVQFDQLHSIFLSAKSDFEGGYLFDVRNLVHASVFTDELDQAKHFLDAGHKLPAAVIAGTVLETTLRELCEQHDDLESADKLNRMNDDLAKANVYNASRKSQIKAWADIRNSAAHGKPEEFEPPEVTRMIDGIRDFVANQLSS